MESLSQNPEFRNNPENFHPGIYMYMYLYMKQGHNVAPKRCFLCHGILQRNYRKMTIKWSFSYNSIVKLSLYNTVHDNMAHSYGPQTWHY